MNNDFCFDKKSTVYLYGAATRGELFCRYLSDAGYMVKGFIDRRAMEINRFCGKEVFTLEQFRALDKETDTAVVIVSIKNVFEHSAIARDLSDQGIENLIYRPISIIREKKGTRDEQLLMDCYERIETEKLSEPECLPKTYCVQEMNFADKAFICEQDREVTAYVPLELIFTDLAKGGGRDPYSDIPIYCLQPHIELFDYFSGGSLFPQKYMDYCSAAAENSGQVRVTESWKRNILENRDMVYQEMSLSLSINPDFFIKNAPFARWNDRGYFNLCGGKHRAAFYVMKSLRFMPLRMRRSDYDAWQNIAEFEKFKDFLHRKKIRRLKHFVPHPNLYYFPYDYKLYGFDLLYHVVRELVHIVYEKTREYRLDGLSVLDYSNDGGWIYGELIKFGCKVVRKGHDDDLAEALRTLQSLKIGGSDQNAAQFRAVLSLENQERTIPVEYFADSVCFITDQENAEAQMSFQIVHVTEFPHNFQYKKLWVYSNCGMESEL